MRIPEPPGPDDPHGDWPERLLDRLSKAPLVPEELLSHRSGWPEIMTPCELRVVQAMSYGMTREMAAELLGVSGETVKTQLESIRFRLKAKNTTHACCEALRRGLIS